MLPPSIQPNARNINLKPVKIILSERLVKMVNVVLKLRLSFLGSWLSSFFCLFCQFVVLILQASDGILSREPKWNHLVKRQKLAVDVGVHVCPGLGKGFLVLDHFLLDEDCVFL